jgi:predicted peroxiredoxin
MFQVRKVSLLLTLILAATLLSSIASLAAETAPDDKTALSGLKEGKAIFDIDLGDPKKLLTMLSVIGQTAESLVAQGVKPNFVLAFRGASSLYVSSDRRLIPLSDYETADHIAAEIKELGKKDGIRMEQCSVAAKMRKVDSRTIPGEVHFVGNSFISMIGYQARGYALIPIH